MSQVKIDRTKTNYPVCVLNTQQLIAWNTTN